MYLRLCASRGSKAPAMAAIVTVSSVILVITIWSQGRTDYQRHSSATPHPPLQESATTGMKFERIPWDLRNSVTPIIHHSWKTRQLPTARAIRWRATWKSCFPDWEMKLWTDDDNLELIREQYPWFLPTYLSFKRAIERVDIARYFYLHRYGGIYTDLDNICVRNFENLLKTKKLIFGGMAFIGNHTGVSHTLVQNSFMASRPGHPFWLRLITWIMMKKTLSNDYEAMSVESKTGPFALMEELQRYNHSGASDFVIYPSKYFNPYSWSTGGNARCKDYGKMSQEDEKACIAAYPEAYVVQLHAATWHGGSL